MKRRSQAWPFELRMEAVRAYKRGMSCREIGAMLGMSMTSVARSVRRFKKHGTAGLEPQARKKGGGSRKRPKTEAAEQAVSQMTPLPEGTGIGKVQGLLYRLGFLKVSRGTASRAMKQLPMNPKKPARRRRRNRPPKIRHFERAKPNDLWQTDIMTFMLKGQYRVYLMAFMDDNSRFIVGWGLFRSQTTANVQEVFRAAVEKHSPPKEVLTDNGRQYYTWRGKSQFTVMLTKMGIAHIRSRPYHPQTLGKIESFWRNLWQEVLSQVPLSSFEDAQRKIGEYVEHYNYKRPHQGIGNLVPADRYYRVSGEVKKLVEENTTKVEASPRALEEYKPPTYLIGNIGGKELRVVAKDAQVLLREERPDAVESVAEVAPETEAPGVSSPDGAGEVLAEECDERTGAEETGEPAGEAGVGLAVPEQAGPGDEVMPGGGSVEGTVLPVASSGEGGVSEGVGAEGTGSEAGEAGGGAWGGPEASEADGSPGEGPEEDAQGPGSLAAESGDGPADHPAQRLGADTQDGA